MNMVYSHCAKQRTYVGGCAVAHFLFSNERVGAIFFSSAKKKSINTKSRISFNVALRNGFTNKKFAF
jgi:hypothetical protein